MERIFLRVGTVLVIPGALLLIAFFASGVDFDDAEFVKEPFYLLGIGTPLFLVGLMLVLGVLAARVLNDTRESAASTKNKFPGLD